MPRQRRLKRIKLLQWKQFLKDNHITWAKFVRTIYPEGLPEGQRTLYLQKVSGRVKVEEEENTLLQ